MGVEREVNDSETLKELEGLYRSRFDKFLRTASAIANSREGGRDAVHDAFVAAVRGRDGYRGEANLEAWLWRIVVTKALNERRKRSALGALYADVDANDVLWVSSESVAGEWLEIRSAIASLPERQRLILFLRYYGDLDYRAIADAIGVQMGTVGSELHAAHASLRERLEGVLIR